jgi:acyl transferase domain-containing protein/NADPH:quinone reductase-like Zn-dependent oxidoreductase/acyl carrier protein
MTDAKKGRAPAFPLAIVGLSCRLPGANSPDELWTLLTGRVDAVGEVPHDRWDADYFYHPDPSRANRTYTKAGGFIADIDKFDAAFFGISPREAGQMDPQQRLALELVWEALDSTGRPPTSWAGGDAGVFFGVSAHDYWTLHLEQGELSEPYVMTGSAVSILSNRVSYIFDLHGPSMSIDTACSSSLVALHEACSSLWSGESPVAIVGGVNLVLSPFCHVGFSHASMLSPTGRCRAFDAKGDGYVRSEGGGVVVLRPLDDALADGNPIHAVILATGVNSDGRTSGISLPNPVAQEQLLRRVYGGAGIDPADVSYVEAHGTGTVAGDPLECQALGNVFGAARAPGDPLPIGSIKSNIGHLEAASGMAGLLKVVLALKHRAVTPTIHFETPNPNIPFADINLAVVTEQTSLGARSMPLTMGINSFGFGGTNAHAVLREYVGAAVADAPSPRALEPLLISARSPVALVDMAKRYRALLADAMAPSLAAVCRAAALQRSHHSHRFAIVGRTAADIVERLDLIAGGAVEALVATAPGRTKPARIAFVFSGNGSQWLGMGRDLLAMEPVFAEWLGRVDRLLSPLLGWHVVDALKSDAVADAFDKTEIAQPALFALQVGVLEWLRAHGVVGEANVGHSVGEVAAAYAAGILSLEQACQVIAHRSQAQAVTAGAGKMAALGMDVDAATALIAPYGARVTIASVNSPGSVTLAGDEACLREIDRDLEGRGIFFRLLALDYAFHSAAMDPIEKDLLRRLADLAPGVARTRFVSTVTGDDLDGFSLDASYWWNNVRRPVQFAAAIDRLTEGIDLFIEIGPHPVLSMYLRECLRARDSVATALSTLRRNEPEQKALWSSLANCYVNGGVLDFNLLFPEDGPLVDLPSYPWQREHYWLHKRAEPLLPNYGPRVHPLLGYRLPTSDGVWKNDLELLHHAWLRDHVVQGTTVFPAAGYIELALAAAEARTPDTPVEIEGFDIRRPLILSDERSVVLEVRLANGDNSFEIGAHDGQANGRSTAPVVAGRLVPSATTMLDAVVIGDLQKRLPRRIDQATHYRRCAERGLAYGPAFQGVADLWCGDGEALGRIETPAVLAGEIGGYRLHPALLDACLQVTFGAIAGKTEHDADTASFLPTSIDRLRLFETGAGLAWCHVTLTRRSRRLLVARLSLLDADGGVIGELDGLQLRRLEMSNGAAVPLYCWRAVLQDSVSRPRGVAGMPTVLSLVADASRPATDRGLTGALDRLAVSYAWRVVAALADRDSVNVPLLVARGSIAADRAIYFSSLLHLLARHGLASRQAGDWQLSRSDEPTAPEELWRDLVARHPEALASLQLVGRCGDRLADFLRGTIDGTDIVFPARDFNSAEQFFQSDPFSRDVNDALQRILRQVADRMPSDRRLHILEVGSTAGSGVTSSLLSVLPPDRTDYVYAAPTADAVAGAEATFADARMLRGAVLDLQRNPSTQGFGVAQVDVIVAANALHEAEDLRTALGHLHAMLKPGGILVMIEPDGSDFLGFVFGMTPSWWSFTDIDLRPETPLLSPAVWRQLLLEAGFADVAVVDGEDAANRVLVAGVARGDLAPVPTHRTVEPANWLMFLDDAVEEDVAAARLVADAIKLLEAAGQTVVRIHEGDDVAMLDRGHVMAPLGDAAAYRRLFEILAGQGYAAPINLLFLRGLALAGDIVDPVSAQEHGSIDLLSLVQAADAADPALSLRLSIVTAGAVSGAPHGDLPNPAQAPLWGLGRTLMNERPGLACRMIDIELDTVTSDDLVDALLDPGNEDEVMLRNAARYVHRLQRGLPIAPVDRHAPGEVPPFKLALQSHDGQETLGLQAIALPLPGAGDVLVRVRAAGLNFRDVLQRTGLLPEEAFEGGFAGATLGMEFAGEIVAVGPEVTGLAKGDEVFGFAPSAMSSHLVAKAFAVFPKAKGWSFAAAATTPVAHLTVFYSLSYLARLRRGERVLIHGGAGGVGLAAIQYAQSIGCEIFASAGTAEKRDFLRRLGVHHVIDSRSLGFADEVRRITGGEGVDVVLNSLAGEAIQKGVALLRPYGRFIELGKRDFYANSKLGLAPFRNNIQFFGVDVDRLLLDRPALTAELFQDITRLMEDGVLRPLVHRVFPVIRSADAFRHMQQSHHIGKVVLSFDTDAVAGARIDRPMSVGPLSLSSDATYLVTGGRGGFGLATAEWLASKGARHLALVGRNMATKPEAAAIIDRLTASGVTVREIVLDVTDGAALAGILRLIGKEMPALRGIVHAAAVIDDAALANMTPDKFRAALNSKMLGAWQLDRLTRNLSLDFFIFYSSAVTLIGNPGQSNYLAANLYLEALAHHRRAAGLPALAMQWGAIAEAGHVGRNPELAKFMTERLGVVPIALRRAFDAMERALLADATEVAAADLSWSRLAALPNLAKSPKYAAMRDLLTVAVGGDSARDAAELGDLLAGKSPDEALATVTQLVVKQVAGVMRMSAAKLDLNQSLIDLGMDSLMVVELQLALEQQLGVSIPTLELMDIATVGKLARRVVDAIVKTPSTEMGQDKTTAAGPNAAANGHAAANGAAVGGDGHMLANGHANGHGNGNGHAARDEIDVDGLAEDALDDMLYNLLKRDRDAGLASMNEERVE